MSARVAVGTFNVTATGSVAVTGLGFQPKAIILLCAGNGSVDTTQITPYTAIAALDGTTVRAIASSGAEGVSDAGMHTDNASVRCISPGLTLVQQFTLTSMDSGGFTLNVTTATTAFVWLYIAFGGSVSAKVGSFTASSSTGNQSVTGVGFEPQLVFLFGNNVNGTGGATGTANVAFGTTIKSRAGSIAASVSINHFTSADVAKSYHNTAKSYGIVTSSVQQDGVINAMGSDGFTINWATTGASYANQVNYLCLRGFYDLFLTDFTKSAATGLQSFSAASGFTPDMVIFHGARNAASASVNAEAMIGIGASTVGTSSTRDVAITVGIRDGVNTVKKRRTSNAHYSGLIYDPSTAVTSQFDVTALRPSGFTINESVAYADSWSALLVGATHGSAIFAGGD